MSLPDGYVRLELGGSRVFVRREATEWAREALEEHDTLHEWAAGRPGARAMEGRGRVWDVPAPVAGPDGRTRWAVRHYRRGGAVAAPLLDDRYLPSLDDARPLRELCCSHTVRARGIPTPAVMAGAVYPAGIFYRADLVTEVVPDAVDLRDLLFDEGSVPEVADPAEALRVTGRLVRRMERSGVYHPDLNAANVLVAEGNGEEPEVWILDLDRCQDREEGTPAPRGPMRDRLRRSLRKLERKAGAELTPALWAALEQGLEERGEDG